MGKIPMEPEEYERRVRALLENQPVDVQKEYYMIRKEFEEGKPYAGIDALTLCFSCIKALQRQIAQLKHRIEELES